MDVDVDEPALTIRWSIIACGQAFILPGSGGAHGSADCGLPAMSLSLFVDGSVHSTHCRMIRTYLDYSGSDPAATYDPTLFPYSNDSGQRNR